jgi:serum/glucocorticoid-regulated kinase 2
MLSSMLGKSKPSRPTTPTPADPQDDGGDNWSGSGSRTGTLSIRVASAKGLTLPASARIPSTVQAALISREGQLASCVSPSSVSQQRLATSQGHQKRASVQRKPAWFMPYLVLEYDVNQVLVDALGGSDLWNPVCMHEAQL